jgi:hypothetical protein
MAEFHLSIVLAFIQLVWTNGTMKKHSQTCLEWSLLTGGRCSEQEVLSTYFRLARLRTKEKLKSAQEAKTKKKLFKTFFCFQD